MPQSRGASTPEARMSHWDYSCSRLGSSRTEKETTELLGYRDHSGGSKGGTAP
jgi:hypothetical protein